MEIIIDGNRHELPRPTMAMWLKLAELENSEKDSESMVDILKGRYDIIKEFYQLDDEEAAKLPVEDILPAYNDMAGHIMKCALDKLKALPNKETGKE